MDADEHGFFPRYPVSIEKFHEIYGLNKSIEIFDFKMI
jgi:hypothetical protein